MITFSFKRITSNGLFIPEIDGLRFIAIFSVVIFHLQGFISVRDVSIYEDHINYQKINYFISHGHLGVPLFFVISGFILGMPFARHYILKQPKVSLKNYFFRRLTRLEPPYLLSLTVLFFASVYVAHTLSLAEAFKSYFSSVLYSHNIVYGRSVLPLINCVTWSLEVEVQFYLIAPLIALIFKVSSHFKRRLFLLVMIFVFTLVSNYIKLPFISLFEYIQYFLLGFLLVDFYLSGKERFVNLPFKVLFAHIALIGMWIWDGNEISNAAIKFFWELYFIADVFVLCYLVLISSAIKILSKNIISTIGGMCYSIYLLHYPVISIAGNFITKYSFSKFSFLNVSVYSIFILSQILICSALYFLLIERPCMSKDWHKRLKENLFKNLKFKFLSVK